VDANRCEKSWAAGDPLRVFARLLKLRAVKELRAVVQEGLDCGRHIQLAEVARPVCDDSWGPRSPCPAEQMPHACAVLEGEVGKGPGTFLEVAQTIVTEMLEPGIGSILVLAEWLAHLNADHI